MKISENPTIELITQADAERKKTELRKKNAAAFRNHRRKWKFESTNEGINYQVYAHILRLKKDEVYIEIDNQGTSWECRDHTDGYLIHKNVKNVVFNGKVLTVYCDDLVQEYRFCEKIMCFEKLKHDLGKNEKEV
jgi:hypothetical protein